MEPTTTFQGQQVHLISQGNCSAWVAPQFGGRLLRWSCGNQELIRWPENADWSKVNKMRGGNPLLFPFIARHMVDGKIGFWKDGETIREMPMHGFARELPFDVINRSTSSIHMRLKDNEITRRYYPFSFHFDVVIELQKERAMKVCLCTENLSDQPMPYYPGHHFYFNIPSNERPHWKIKIPCSQTARQTPDGNLVFHPQSMVHASFDDEDLIDRFHILKSNQAICFHHEKGSPRFLIHLDHPDTIPWTALTTWTESPKSDFYCVEPWVGLPNAIHHLHGLRLLPPGAREEAICVVDCIC